ncbi:TBPIP-domain-containing protein [Eremomyces bilateralis CBS 781.70]|uniref:TBPIP-domain-containing protein n=1 Tax=Eremomyces bilateralis CBS 781.70 TaxID=1392243 RepID=A0A6G1FZL7_9PEZI|nr:TBPIP-domain-containing protein [Eremomyces bilateralis CBS 781.70]KAF1811297.1 TBPIP-domain-containing protein [Eremomyces bilateralis CBS 781.70]
MAPRKEKEAKASGDQAADMILTYLRKQNRPYSAIDISANLHNKVTKTVAVKVLKDLHERKTIEGRAAGKQLVYHAIQTTTDDCSPDALADLDAQITTLRDEVTDLRSQSTTLKSQLQALSSEQSPTELLTSIATREAEKASLTAKLEKLRGGEVAAVPEAERVRVEAAVRNWRAIEGRRRKIAGDLWAEIEEGVRMSGGDVQELKEQFGLA